MTKKSINLHKNNLDKKKGYDFPGQHENEKIALVTRKHLIVLLPYFLYIALMCLLPIIFYIFIVPYVLPAFMDDPHDRLFILLSAIYYGFVWIVIFTVWADYYLDIWIITNERIIDVEQIGFFNRVVSELDLKRIQDITSSVHGMLPTMFGFGNIHIQTAAEEGKFDLKSVPHPVTIRRRITKLYKAAREKDRFIFKGDE
ncbi:PH domain-containing protein [Candidatus Parcubacteria bacterium]|nr:PH domain-containing protein [Candidatus Parcubacteria bacterium]